MNPKFSWLKSPSRSRAGHCGVGHCQPATSHASRGRVCRRLQVPPKLGVDHISFLYPWRIHGAAIYGNMTGVYWWDPWITIYGSTMDPSWGIIYVESPQIPGHLFLNELIWGHLLVNNLTRDRWFMEPHGMPGSSVWCGAICPTPGCWSMHPAEIRHFTWTKPT